MKLLPTVALGLAATAALSVPSADPDKPAPVDFNRDIRPILAEKCLLCHGPDERDRAADLRLDLRESAFEDRGGYAAIVPGEPGESELFLRVSDDFDPMPPEDFDAPLTAEEVALFERWIAEGANWEEHWAYTKPGRAAPPAVGDEAWLRDPLDRYVLAGLEAAGLEPSPEAEPEALLRRLSLDLTGLPPTPAEVDAFLADDAPGAYERQVDRLLDSPRYGEHMARYWLDAARYGDTHGFHLDNVRSLWRWREWVIEAFNANQPFDRFTVEQLAGDLLPDPTLDQLIATGFNRCNPDHRRGRTDRRGVPGQVRGGPRRDDLDGVPRHHDGVRRLPRPQVRPLLPAGVLRALRLLPLLRRAGLGPKRPGATAGNRRPHAGNNRRSWPGWMKP